MNINSLSLFLIFLYLVVPICKSENISFNQQNNFGGFGSSINKIGDKSLVITDDSLIDENINSCNSINVQEFNLKDAEYSYRIKFANLNNRENKNYSYYDKSNNKKIKISNTKWGVVWNYVDAENYNYIELQCMNTALYSLDDARRLHIKIAKRKDSKENVVCDRILSKRVNLYDGYNTIELRCKNNRLIVLIGNEQLVEVANFEEDLYSKDTKIGYFVGPGAKLKINNISISLDKNMNSYLATDWTIESLNKYFAKSEDELEGYWTYLDRNLNKERLGIGGEYRLAIVKEDDSYTILYINGAKINRSNWRECMVKGKLKETQFVNHYNLVWYDAMMEAFESNVFAKVDENMILELNFPIQKSKLRFAKE